MKNNFIYRLYGRSKGRKKNFLLNNLPSNINLKNIDHSLYNIIDIGCGYGESTIELACSSEKKIVIACEKYLDGLNNIVKEVDKNLLKNVFIFKGNIHQLIDELCYENSISEIWILFPDPWPKKRHHKRRLINHTFLNYIHNFLKDSGRIMIATDSISYMQLILSLIYEFKHKYEWENQNYQTWNYEFLDLAETKFYKKALNSNRKSTFFSLKKI